MGSAWKNQWSVGNAIIDSEHRNLLVMADGIASTIKAGNVSAVPDELEQFEYWLCDHFENEEEIALAIGFDFAANALEHRKLLNEFQRMKDWLISDTGKLPKNAAQRYARFSDECLAAHILNEDMRMKPALQAYAYDFTPDHPTKSEAHYATRAWHERFNA